MQPPYWVIFQAGIISQVTGSIIVGSRFRCDGVRRVGTRGLGKNRKRETPVWRRRQC